MPPNNIRRGERGNVFVFILLGIVLFAALTLALTRGMRGETTGAMTAQKAVLAAADILDHAQQLGRAVDHLRRRGISENDISFEQASDPAYDAHGQPPANQVFHVEGGKAAWKTPPAGANDGSGWTFTGATCIPGIGEGAASCDTDTVSNEELLAVLSGLNESVCWEINRRLGITGIPADSGGGAAATKYTGNFADGTKIALPGGPFSAACFSQGSGHHFYAVLIAR